MSDPCNSYPQDADCDALDNDKNFVQCIVNKSGNYCKQPGIANCNQCCVDSCVQGDLGGILPCRQACESACGQVCGGVSSVSIMGMSEKNSKIVLGVGGGLIGLVLLWGLWKMLGKKRGRKN